MHMNEALKLLLLDESTSVNEKKIEGKNDASKTITKLAQQQFQKNNKELGALFSVRWHQQIEMYNNNNDNNHIFGPIFGDGSIFGWKKDSQKGKVSTEVPRERVKKIARKQAHERMEEWSNSKDHYYCY